MNAWVIFPPSFLSAFLHTPLTPHFRTDHLTIGTLATKWVQLLITQLTVAYPTHWGSRHVVGSDLRVVVQGICGTYRACSNWAINPVWAWTRSHIISPMCFHESLVRPNNLHLHDLNLVQRKIEKCTWAKTNQLKSCLIKNGIGSLTFSGLPTRKVFFHIFYWATKGQYLLEHFKRCHNCQPL